METEERTAVEQLEQTPPDYDGEERAEIVDFLKKMHEAGWTFRGNTKNLLLDFFRLTDKAEAVKEKNKEVERKERIFRDSLPETGKVNYLLERLKRIHFCGHTAAFQKQVLGLIRDGQPLSLELSDMHYYTIEQVVKQFYGCSMAIYQNVIDRYIDEILPGIEAEQERIEAEQDAA